jgi:hypothetical protein
LDRWPSAILIYIVMAAAVGASWSWWSLPVAIALGVGFAEISPIRLLRGWPMAVGVAVAGALTIMVAGFVAHSAAGYALLVAATTFGAGFGARWGLYAVAGVVPLLLVILSAPNSPEAALPQAAALIAGGLLGTLLIGVMRTNPPTTETTIPLRTAILIGAWLALVVGGTTFLTVQYEIDQGHWIPISVLMIAVPSLEATRHRSWLRTSATVGGAAAASVVAAVATSDVVVIGLALLAGVLSAVVARTYFWVTLLITVSVVLYSGGGEHSHTAAIVRIAATVLGAVIVLTTAQVVALIDRWLDEEHIMTTEP